jgi:hypothetical protein|tara:strand:+ start:49484 stop:49696 length:213 start_codon:yes stop_codon:yes gene_type:complete
MSTEIIENIIKIKNILISCEKNDEINIILKKVDEFLLKHCRHEIVDDLIDIDPDRSKSIRYCEKCFITFS